VIGALLGQLLVMRGLLLVELGTCRLRGGESRLVFGNNVE
jgi:hypothetical protein